MDTLWIGLVFEWLYTESNYLFNVNPSSVCSKEGTNLSLPTFPLDFGIMSVLIMPSE